MCLKPPWYHAAAEKGIFSKTSCWWKLLFTKTGLDLFSVLPDNLNALC